ncbi:MAG: ornithine cyclodeaminase family protein, partial [Desulfobacteraceae bacterium]|nr:ornithine cyclodeaminase family protein [Desulfobacteraceae bacterium]
MTKIYTLDRIKKVIQTLDLSGTIEKGFIAYSRGEVIVPPVGELVFKNPPGDTHIKYGYIKDTPFYVIKIASGFYENPALGLASSSGLMLVCSQKTGFPLAILLDEGYLTNVRTAVAGQIAAKHMAQKKIRAIGVLGTGIQARMQVAWLSSVTPCKKIFVWGRTPKNLKLYKKEMETKGYEVTMAKTPADVAKACNLIVTTTPSRTPLLTEADIRPGTHITAMGSDTPQKQELDSNILKKADLVVADSVSQCRERG